MPKIPKKPSRGMGFTAIRSLKAAGQSWQLQTAKARFSEVFRLARIEGPQRITRQGKEAVVMLGFEVISVKQLADSFGLGLQQAPFVTYGRFAGGIGQTGSWPRRRLE